MYCFFYALAHLRLADAILLNYSIPLFMPFVESAWLGEPFPRRLWGVILLGFAGIVLILKPGVGVFQPVALVGLLSALFASVAQVGHPPPDPHGARGAHRLLLRPDLHRHLGGAAACRSGAPRPAALWALLAGLGILATAGQLALTRPIHTRPPRAWARSSTARSSSPALMDWCSAGCCRTGSRWPGRCSCHRRGAGLARATAELPPPAAAS